MVDEFSAVRRYRRLGTALLLLTVGLWQAAALESTEHWCYKDMHLAVYAGSEVECEGSYPENACEAFCDLCFGSDCEDIQHCVEGTGIGFYCVPLLPE